MGVRYGHFTPLKIDRKNRVARKIGVDMIVGGGGGGVFRNFGVLGVLAFSTFWVGGIFLHDDYKKTETKKGH